MYAICIAVLSYISVLLSLAHNIVKARLTVLSDLRSACINSNETTLLCAQTSIQVLKYSYLEICTAGTFVCGFDCALVLLQLCYWSFISARNSPQLLPEAYCTYFEKKGGRAGARSHITDGNVGVRDEPVSPALSNPYHNLYHHQTHPVIPRTEVNLLPVGCQR